jgi:hypothetical protein
MPLPPKVLQAKERAPSPDFFIVSTLNSHWSLSRSLGTRQSSSFVPLKLFCMFFHFL